MFIINERDKLVNMSIYKSFMTMNAKQKRELAEKFNAILSNPAFQVACAVVIVYFLYNI